MTGIDIDPEAIASANKNIDTYQPNAKIDLQKGDAWNLQQNSEFDMIMSNGLGIYVSDFKALRALYNNFYKALKPNGTIIASFVTPPPIIDLNSPWGGYDDVDIKMQMSIFVDIVQANFMCYRTEQTMREMFTDIGYKNLDIIYDQFGIYPTITGVK